MISFPDSSHNFVMFDNLLLNLLIIHVFVFVFIPDICDIFIIPEHLY